MKLCDLGIIEECIANNYMAEIAKHADELEQQYKKYQKNYPHTKKTTNPYKSRISGAPANNRSDKIRTCDLCVPNAALYQTEPRFVNLYQY